MLRSRALAGLCLGLGLSTAAACRGPVAVDPAAPVILVSIDTLRADRLGAYGSRLGATPNLDALARESVVFENVYSHCPLTLPAHASLLTGLLPPRHGVRDNVGFRLGSDSRTLASRFQEAGRTTGAAVSAYVLRRATGIAQGFDAYDDAVTVDAADVSLGDQQRDGAVAVESLLRFVEATRERPFFAFLHLYEPHTPWRPPPRHAHFAHPYDGDVAYADELAGRFVAALRAHGLLDRSLLVVTSDHGEGLGDHAEQEHGLLLYREAVRVPLLVRLPRAARAGTRVTGVAAQVDIPATILDLVGLAGAGLDGASLRAAIDGGAAPGRPVYSETYFPRLHFGWSELLSASDERYRFIRAPRPELFDVRDDPGETRNLAAQRAPALASMGAWLDRQAQGRSVTPERVPAEVRRRLEALGYVGGGAPAAAPPGPLADPKDRVRSYEAYKRALALAGEGRDAEAAGELERLVRENPGMADAWEALGLALARRDRGSEAVRALDKALELDPARASTHLALVRVHGLAGRRELAEKHAEAASALDPGEGYELLAQMMLEVGRLDAAAADARRSLAVDPTRLMSHFVLGAVARRKGRCAEAVPEYRAAAAAAALQKGTVVRNLHAGMADCLARLGREPEAEQEFLAEIEAIPYSPEARVGLAMLYRSQGRDAEARRALEGVVTSHPAPGPGEYAAVIRSLGVLGDLGEARAWQQRAHERFPQDPRFR